MKIIAFGPAATLLQHGRNNQGVNLGRMKKITLLRFSFLILNFAFSSFPAHAQCIQNPTWQVLATPFDPNFNFESKSVAIGPDGTLYVGTPTQGIFQSTDHGL